MLSNAFNVICFGRKILLVNQALHHKGIGPTFVLVAAVMVTKGDLILSF